MQNIFSSTAWLCKEERAIQSEGVEGELKFDGKSITFTPTDIEQSVQILIGNLKLADLNNIVGQSQMVLYSNDGQKYVFVFHKPVSGRESTKMVFSYPKGYSNYLGFSRLGQSIQDSTKWKEVLVNALPADRVRARKEIRIGFILLWTIIIIALIVGIFVLIINIIT